MTQAVPSLLSKLTNQLGLVQKPWNSFFQQFSSPPSRIIDIDITASPMMYAAGEPGTLVITGGTLTNVTLIRGPDSANLGTVRQILLMIKDTAQITYSVAPTDIQFLPFYGAPR